MGNIIEKLKKFESSNQLGSILKQSNMIFCDGGLLGSQKKDRGCELGGTWAWVAVERDVDAKISTNYLELGGIGATARYIASDSGVVLATAVRGVTNNHTEQIAIIKALESLVGNWSGTIFTDSRTALLRVQSDYEIYNLGKERKETSEKGLPPNISNRSKKAVSRLGKLKFVLLQGHPKPDELEHGWGRKRDLPVSKWNVHCDDACNHEKENYFKNKKGE